MSKLLNLKPLWLFVIYVILDILCTGMGMGVPIFCIILGFPVGWFALKYINREETSLQKVLPRAFHYAILISVVTLVGMVLIWGPAVQILFDPGRDIANFGIPMILYEPMASFIGWMVLMVFISPFLQFLTAILGTYMALLDWLNPKKVIQAPFST